MGKKHAPWEYKVNSQNQKPEIFLSFAKKWSIYTLRMLHVCYRHKHLTSLCVCWCWEWVWMRQIRNKKKLCWTWMYGENKSNTTTSPNYLPTTINYIHRYTNSFSLSTPFTLLHRMRTTTKSCGIEFSSFPFNKNCTIAYKIGCSIIMHLLGERFHPHQEPERKEEKTTHRQQQL